MRSVIPSVVVPLLTVVPAQADVGWFVADYVRVPHPTRVFRACGMDAYTAHIRADGGDWQETEILGNACLVKVRASAATLATIAADSTIRRLPKDALNLSLADLTPTQKATLRNQVLALGYTVPELQAAFPLDLGNYTLRDVLRFMATRRLRPRYDSGTDTIVLDGPTEAPMSVDLLDARVP